MKENRKKGYVFLIITFILWGSLYVVSKYVLGKMPTFTISFFRFVLAFLALSIITGKTEKKIEKQDYKYILLIGVAGYFIAVGAQLLGTKYAGASMASLINSMNPVTMTIFGAILLKEKLNMRKIAGIILAVVGVYAILGNGAKTGATGIILSIFSVILWSVVSVFTRKITQKYDSLQVTRYGTGIATICYFPVCVLELLAGETVRIDGSCIISLLYMGIICTGAAYFLWNKSLSTLEAGTCSAFYPIQPLVSTVFGIILLHEKVDTSFFIGAIFIVAGVFINLKGSR